jgi:hypothetical protein
MLIAQLVELMRDLQIEGLPCELVTPVRLHLKETRVLTSLSDEAQSGCVC